MSITATTTVPVASTHAGEAEGAELSEVHPLLAQCIEALQGPAEPEPAPAARPVARRVPYYLD